MNKVTKLLKPVLVMWTAEKLTDAVYARVTEICFARGYTRLAKVFRGSIGKSAVSFLIAQVLKYTPVVRKLKAAKNLSEACEVVSVAVLEVAALESAWKYVKGKLGRS
jgi:hypothetical protein